MTPRNRAILRWIFIVVFLLIAPVIILSTAGYRLNFGTRRLVRTGVIILDTSPAGAKIWLNGSDTKAVTPARLTHVLPGGMHLRVEKPGFRSWEKDVNVDEGQTLFLTDVTLFPDALPVIERERAGIIASAISRDGRFAGVASREHATVEVRVFDFKTGTDRLIQRASDSAGPVTLAWSADGRRLLIRTQGTHPVFQLWDAANPLGLTDFVSLLPDAPSEVFWGNGGQTLFAADATTLYEFDLSAHLAQATGPSAESLSVVRDVVFGLKKRGSDTVVVRRTLSEGTFETLIALPDGQWSPLADEGALLGFIASDGRLALVDEGAKAIAFEGRGQDGAWSSDGRRLAYWNSYELRVFDTQAHTDELVTRVSTPIVRAAWIAGDRDILFAAGGTLSSIESRHPGSRLVTMLATLQTLTDFAVPNAETTAWLTGSVGHADGLFSLPLR